MVTADWAEADSSELLVPRMAGSLSYISASPPHITPNYDSLS